MLGFVTDRTQANVDRLKTLSAKGWANMTPAEQAEWTGDPLTAADFGYENPVNLLPNGPVYSSDVSLSHLNKHITATSAGGGVYLYAVSIIGPASDYEGKTFTFSVEDIRSTGGGTPLLNLYWHDDTGFEFAGGTLSEPGSMTFTAFENTNNRAYLALYVYVTTDSEVAAGASIRYSGVMLEFGDVRHEYVPYTPILPTPATKGAFNYSDLNRIGTAINDVAYRLGYIATPSLTKTNWGVWSIPRASDLDTLWGQYFTLLVRYSQEHGGIPVETGDIKATMTTRDANNVEAGLKYVYNLVFKEDE